MLFWLHFKNATKGPQVFYNEYNVSTFIISVYMFVVIAFSLIAINLPDTDF